jgi:hypothetical protein
MDECTESIVVVSTEAASLPIDFRDELDRYDKQVAERLRRLVRIYSRDTTGDS